ncbi:SGNH/GDSL hydrolase family protein [Collimonas humicola]|uniref:SGNH/GDSL hydrolase family protein n=1 Tax=Collimonas humicola TaxID=2825886 RepID=UPI001E3B8DF7|nr:SGNH/GDSL hydrolase family protein [Collimonas humicola]
MARLQMRDAIQSEIMQRTQAHQARIAGWKWSSANLLAAGASAPPKPLTLLAHGDSWFDYPLDGNGFSPHHTDIIAHLESMGTVSPLIHNVSHHGDATTEEMSWPKQKRLIESLSNPGNWFDEKPDAILFSGGGNDIAGEQFCIFLNNASPAATGLNANRLQKALGIVEASYLALFSLRDTHAPDVPIFGHSYDFPIPSGIHPLCAGPWLLPSLIFCGWDKVNGAKIVRSALKEFDALLMDLANVATNKFILIDTQGSLDQSAWANELHPHPVGFKKLAEKFVDALRTRFPGRI